MSRSGTPAGSFWPSPLQRQLLVVALGDRETAIAAWRALRPFDLENLEPGSFQLLPLVYRSLSESGEPDVHLARLKGIYRREWVRNNLLVERTQASAAALERIGVRALFIEGVLLAQRFYPDPGLRTTAFVDVLVDEAEVRRALAALTRCGWTRAGGSAEPRGPHYLRDAGRNGCRVRTTLAFDFVLPRERERTHEALFAAAQQYDLGGQPLLVPNPSDTLLAVCVTGARHGQPIQWLADAAMVVRVGAVEWDRVVDLAAARGQAHRVADALAYLSQLSGPPPDANAIVQLRRVPRTLRGRIVEACAAGSVPRFGALSAIVAEHLAATSDRSGAHALATLPRELRSRWGLERNRQLPVAALRRARRVLARQHSGEV